MKNPVEYLEIELNKSVLTFLGIVAAVLGAGLLSALYMEHEGHWVTGMSNQIVWGLPHVFAVFLIVAASGALNIASIGTVFDKYQYKPLGRLSAWIAMALLVGGLMILVLDLGRPDRLIVAATEYNFRSIFAWNMILYNGFLFFTGVYLWFMMDYKMHKHYPKAGFAAFIWRLVLTTGTGSIFGFIVARTAYASALLAPMFIIMSFSYGLAFKMVMLKLACRFDGRELGEKILFRLKNLLGVFVASALLMTIIHHLTNLYWARSYDYEVWFLTSGGIYTAMFWIGQIGLGTLLPLAIFYHPTLGKNRNMILFGALMVIVGGLAQMYVTIIAGQAYPMPLFADKIVSSSFFDGVVAEYHPSLPEFLLGLGGFAVTILATFVGMRVLRLLPASLSDQVVDPAHSKD